MMKVIRKILPALVGSALLASSAGLSAQASMLGANSLKQLDSDHQPVILVASDSQIRQNGVDARNKYNPNAGVIGQMLGGAKSLDIGGLGNPGVSPRHYAYCVHKYGSYRFSDNTFLSFALKREQCVSPFYQPKN